MGKDTGISWADDTFNPWVGCTRVSPGCQNCYAEELDKRFGGDHWGAGKDRKRTTRANWNKVLRWDDDARKAGTRRRVFCSSMADWLDSAVPAAWLADLLSLIASTPNLTWMLLTKRPESWRIRVTDALADMEGCVPHPVGMDLAQAWLDGDAPANVWVGTTVEDTQRLKRVPHLARIPVHAEYGIRFLSMEPLLEEVDLDPVLGLQPGNMWQECVCAEIDPSDVPCITCECRTLLANRAGVDWVIVGGESGPGAREFRAEWARRIIRSCRGSGVPVFFKQFGDNGSDAENAIASPRVTVPSEYGSPVRRLRGHHGADPSEWPESMRIQQVPEVL